MKQDDRFLSVAIAAAKEAGRIQKVHFGNTTRVELKGETNPVTEVDRLCEKAIVQMIRDVFPDHDLLTEETPFEGRGAPCKWIIDPLDGTTNYLRGYPCFAVSIGLEIEGEMQIGVAYHPILDELFCGEKGKGAFLNGNRLHVSRVDTLDRSFLCTGFPYVLREDPDLYLSYFREFAIRSFAIRRPGSAVLDLCYLAAGRFDGFWELRLHPWDVAAGSLIITEAGGKVTDFRDQPFRIYSDEILASNGFVHSEMLRVIEEIQTVKAERTGQSA
jgi:myo-inositol-1(or 4)-monophosphatase